MLHTGASNPCSKTNHVAAQAQRPPGNFPPPIGCPPVTNAAAPTSSSASPAAPHLRVSPSHRRARSPSQPSISASSEASPHSAYLVGFLSASPTDSPSSPAISDAPRAPPSVLLLSSDKLRDGVILRRKRVPSRVHATLVPCRLCSAFGDLRRQTTVGSHVATYFASFGIYRLPYFTSSRRSVLYFVL